ncbi:MAG: DUF4079 domain-containing protein [Cyanobacteria bacterium P01_D01_bin.44]
MGTADWLRLMHPALAVIVVFPAIGMVSYFAWQTRQRRLKTKAKEKTKIPPVVGTEHVNLGKWLAGAVVGLALIGIGNPIIKHIVNADVLANEPFKVVFIGVMFVLTIASFVFLFKARPKVWRAVFAALTTAGLWILGSQDGVFRRTYEWQISHYYYGMAAATLMIISVAILPEIYKSLSWRRAHIILNCIALVFFMIQGVTGTRDLLEIPLSWQEPFIYSCNFEAKTCE